MPQTQAERAAKARTARLRREYDLSDEDYERLLAFNHGCCWSCDRPPKEGWPLHVEHSHSTGRVRGLVCASCNSAIRKMYDRSSTAFRLFELLVEDQPTLVTMVLGRQPYGRTTRVKSNARRRARTRRARRGKAQGPTRRSKG